jgi:hypothetical protein
MSDDEKFCEKCGEGACSCEEQRVQATIDRYRLLYGERLDKAVGEIQTEIFGGTEAEMVFCFRRHIEEIGFLLDATIAKATIVETGEPQEAPAMVN